MARRTSTRPAAVSAPEPVIPIYHRTSFLLGMLFVLALIIRMPLLGQSLWYDEIYTIIHYVSQPWVQIVSGTYSPNNHVLFSLLAKVSDLLLGTLGLEVTPRLPSLLAGAAAGVALAWPLRKEHPRAALLLGLLAILNPWLIAFSGWARGYALLLLLSIIATHALAQRAYIVYAITLAAALYTHPIAIAIVVGHAAVMLMKTRRPDLKRWAVVVAVAGLATAALYLPFMIGARQYWSDPAQPSISYAQFLQQAFRHAHSGDNAGGVAGLIVPFLACTAGACFAWPWPSLRPVIVTFAVASAFALIVPLAIPLAGEARSALWLIPLYAMGVFGILSMAFQSRSLRWVGVGSSAVLVAFLAVRIQTLIQVPAQPIRDTLQLVHSTVEPDTPVIGLYMAAHEARQIYPGVINAVAYTLEPQAQGEGLPSLKEAESRSPKPPLVIVFYEGFLQRDQPQLWAYLQTNYRVIHRLPGRISPTAIYQRTAAR